MIWRELEHHPGHFTTDTDYGFALFITNGANGYFFNVPAGLTDDGSHNHRFEGSLEELKTIAEKYNKPPKEAFYMRRNRKLSYPDKHTEEQGPRHYSTRSHKPGKGTRATHYIGGASIK